MLELSGIRTIRALLGLFAAVILIPAAPGTLRAAGQARLVINEIHYNPGEAGGESERERFEEEFVELFNSGDVPAELTGWSFTRGIKFSFGSVTVPAGGFVVVVADLETFRRVHPGIDSIAGAYEGRLSNSTERITLVDAAGNEVDDVRYADSGHWARRVTANLRGYDHWEWEAPHDGGGMSLELIDAARDNEFAQAWTASTVAGGTPGKPNSVAKQDRAPFIGKVAHAPEIPSARQEVLVTAKLSAPEGVAVEASVRYRRDGTQIFSASQMFDDGAHGDGEAGDQVWAGAIPPQAHGTIVEFFVQAGAGDSIRPWPPLSSATGGPREALCLFQVDDAFDPNAPRQEGAQPVYHFITPRRELSFLRTLIGRSSANSVYDNRINGTWISVEPGGTRVSYQASARIRGNGSRGRFPPGLRVTFPSDDLWKGVADINMNSQFVHSQVLGAAIYQLMGFPSARSTPVYFKLSGEDWANSDSIQFGHFAHNEVLDDSYVAEHFPSEPDGNLYRGINQASLDYRGEQASRYRVNYSKRNNGSLDDYSDIVALTKALDRENDRSVTDDQFLEEVNRIVDVDQWMRYFALDTLACNLEGGFPTGRGDDFGLFRGTDGRFRLVPYDLDSILGLGERNQELTKSIFVYGETRGLRRLFRHPAVIRVYFKHIREFIDGPYRPEVLNPLINEVLSSWVPDEELRNIKDFIPKRIAVVKSQIEGYTVTGSTLEMAGGFHRTTRPDFILYGRFDPSEFRGARVNGRVPRTDLRGGTWMLRASAGEPLVAPGINPVTVEMIDEAGNVGDRTTLQVWYDSGQMTDVTGAIAGEAHWDAAGGPYLVKESLEIAEGGSLEIEAGSTVFFAAGAGIRAHGGKLSAVGTEARPIRFTSPVSLESGSGVDKWTGIEVEGGSLRIEHAGIDGAGHADGAIRVKDAPVTLRHVTFGSTGHDWITANNAVLAVTESRFADSGGFVRTSGGGVSIEDCEFGFAGGGSAVEIGETAAGIARVSGNIFAGGKEPVLRGRATACVYRNLFGSRGKAEGAAIVTSGPGESIVAGNGFLGWPHGLAIEGAGGARFEKNTLRFGGAEPVAGASERVALADNIVAAGGAPFGFKLPESAWVTRGRPTEWAMLEPAGLPVATGAHAPLLSVEGVPPTGVSGEEPRTLRFRYPGAKSIRAGGGDLPFSGDGIAEFVATGTSSIDVAVTDLTGAEVEFPKAAVWKREPGHVDVMISEVLAVNGGAYVGRNGTPDAVELFNYGSTPVDLHAFRLTDDDRDRDKFSFPESSVIEPGEGLVVELGVKDPEAGTLDAGFGLSGGGESLMLIAPEDLGGGVIDRVTFGNQISGMSVGRVGGEWRLCEPSIGAPTPNRAAVVGDARAVRLSEWLAGGGNGTAVDFIELRNPASAPADISGWGLTDNIANEPFRHRFPPLSFLPADSLTAFFASGKKSGERQLDFKLSEDGEILGFLGPDGVKIDWVAFGAQAPGRSQGRDDSGNLVYFAVPTPGSLHEPEGLAAAESLVASLRISEIHYHPGLASTEFLELANIGNQALDLTGVRLSDGVDFTFEEGAALEPGQRVVVVQDQEAFTGAFGKGIGIAGEFSGKLSNGGETIRLETSIGVTIQEVTYSDQWHEETDGGEKSLEAADLKGNPIDWSKKRAWKAGTPTPGN